MPKAVSGDTLSGIAKANGTTVAQILTDNPVLAARAAAGQTVLFNGTNVKITSPNTASNPYGANLSGQGSGLGTSSVPISSVNSVLNNSSPFKPAPTMSNVPYGPYADNGKILGENNDTIGQGPDEPLNNLPINPIPQYYNAPQNNNKTTETKPIKTATPQYILFNDDEIPVDAIVDLLFENIGGQELLTISRADTVNGQKILYQPIKNLNIIKEQYNPNNILRIQNTSDTFFNSFSIKLSDKIPFIGNGLNGDNVYLDTDGNLVIEFVNLSEGEQAEVEITSSGIIVEVGI